MCECKLKKNAQELMRIDEVSRYEENSIYELNTDVFCPVKKGSGEQQVVMIHRNGDGDDGGDHGEGDA